MNAAALDAMLPHLTIVAPYAAFAALLLALAALIIASRAHARLGRLSLRRGESLEQTIGELSRRVRELQAFREELEEYLKKVELRLQKSVRGVSTVRFNPFEGDGSGGNQSFATAFVDEHGSGVVFSSIHARSGQTNMYAKPIEKSASIFELTGEEREAITRAAADLKVSVLAKNARQD